MLSPADYNKQNVCPPIFKEENEKWAMPHISVAINIIPDVRILIQNLVPWKL